MHGRALIQLITATLSRVVVSSVIGSTSSQNLWTRLKGHFSTVSRTSLFQTKFDLQTIKKRLKLLSQYLQRIKKASDNYFLLQECILRMKTLSFWLLPPKYNTFRCVIRGREKVISLKKFNPNYLQKKLL